MPTSAARGLGYREPQAGQSAPGGPEVFWQPGQSVSPAASAQTDFSWALVGWSALPLPLPFPLPLPLPFGLIEPLFVATEKVGWVAFGLAATSALPHSAQKLAPSGCGLPQVEQNLFIPKASYYSPD